MYMLRKVRHMAGRALSHFRADAARERVHGPLEAHLALPSRQSTDEFIIIPGRDLLPRAWSHLGNPGPLRTFNPTILKHGDEWLFAYRVVGPDLVRRIALCRLDTSFRVVPESQVPLSDWLQVPPGRQYPDQVRTWFADPRLVRLGGRTLLYWNSGWHEPMNSQFLQELEGVGLHPVGFPRELVLRGERRTIEKNWGIFGDGPFYMVYSIVPQRVLEFSLEGTGDLDCVEIHATPWNNDEWTARHGELRGGAPPQRVGDHYYSVGHAVTGTPGDYRYVAGAYRFEARAPFAPTDVARLPLPLPNPFGARTLFERLNPVCGASVYPSGAVHEGGKWIISYGINDEQCAIAVISHEYILGTLRSVVRSQ